MAVWFHRNFSSTGKHQRYSSMALPEPRIKTIKLPMHIPAPPLHKVRIWDFPTRVFHWALAAGVVGLIVSGTLGGNAMVWHLRIGYAVMALLLFRMVWGCVGGKWSRFGAFVYAPRTVFNYLKGRGLPEHSVGHSPIGAMSVFAVLGFLLLQVGTGLISDDEIAFAGPLTRFVSNATVSLATGYHTNIGKWIVLGLVLLHVAAIVFYLIRKHNLISAMLHGDKQLVQATAPSRDDAWSRLAALVILLACAGAVYWVASLETAAF